MTTDCKPVAAENREMVNAFLLQHWHGMTMVLRGEVVDMTLADGYFLTDETGNVIALATYRTQGDVCELLSLDSLRQRNGYGTLLLNRVIAQARVQGCRRMVLITTNDNLNALSFYQRHGFDLIGLYRNAMDKARKHKPCIPLIGEGGIPLRHELELELQL